LSSEQDHTAENENGTERILAFSDGVFAIAITLLVLNLTVPEVKSGLSDALFQRWPAYLSYLLSFVVIGIIWAQHHHIFRFIKRTDHPFLLINIAFLMWVSFIPFPTAVLAQYLKNPTEQRAAMLFYSGTFVVGAALFNLLWRYASYRDRLVGKGIERRSLDKITSSYNLGPISYLVDFILSALYVPAGLALFFVIAVFYAVSPLPGGRPPSVPHPSRPRSD